MESRAKLAGHAIHPMLVVFPLGLLVTAFIFDLIHLGTHSGQWAFVSYWMIAAGIIGGLASAVFGLVDWLALADGTRAKSLGLTHGLGNVVVVALFGVSWFLRRGHEVDPGSLPIILAGAGVVLGVMTSWMGGELVERLGVGIDEGAHLNAPSSLTTPAPGKFADEDEPLRRAS